MIRLAQIKDLDNLLAVYAAARAFMRQNGNPTQWSGGYPSAGVLLADISAGQLYVVEQDGAIGGCFLLADGPDPTYAVIDGGWKSDAPYGVIHRVAGNGTIRGLFHQCAQFARQRYRHLRIDTHADNHPMQHVLQKEGFTFQGIIHLADGSPRLAYEWL